MHRSAVLGCLGVAAVFCSASPAQAYWIHVPKHPHGYATPYAPVAPTAPTYAPITPGQIIAGVHLVWTGYQWVQAIINGTTPPTGTTLPGTTPAPSKPLDPVVGESLNRNQTVLNGVVKMMNGTPKDDKNEAKKGLLDMVKEGDPRLKDVLKNIPSPAAAPAAAPAGNGGTSPVKPMEIPG